MAAIDKIYLNGSYNDYKEFVDWCNKQPLLYDKYNTPCKISSYVYKYTKENWKPGRVVFMGPYYVDAYLIRNCPIESVQKELMLNYGHWSQEKINNAYEIVSNRNEENKEFFTWLTVDDFKIVDNVITIPNLEKSDYQKIKDGEMYASPKREVYEYGRHFKCIKHPKYFFNTPFGIKRWHIDVEIPNYDYMWYHEKHNSWDFYDEFVISDWSSNTAFCKSIKALKRLMLKWKLPIGTIVRARGRYTFDDYEFVITK